MAIGVVLAGGCGDAFSPPEGAEPFAPPAAYSALWSEVEACSQLAAHDFFADDFFTVQHEILHDLVGQPGLPPVFEQCGLLRTGCPS